MKKVLGPKFGPKEPKLVLKLGVFFSIIKFGSLIFLEIACNDSL